MSMRLLSLRPRHHFVLDFTFTFMGYSPHSLVKTIVQPDLNRIILKDYRISPDD